MHDCKVHKGVFGLTTVVSKAMLPQGLVTRCCLVQLGLPFGEATSLQGHGLAREAIVATVATEKWYIDVLVAMQPPSPRQQPTASSPS